MRQIVILLAAMGLGLGIGALTGGFGFSALVCFVAGLFLVTPTLFGLDTAALRLTRAEVRPVALNLVLNFVLLAGAALVIGWLSRDLGIAAALFLLALLPGGGMVMAWIRSAGADVRLGFLLSVVNLALILPVTLAFDAFPDLAAPFFPPVEIAGQAGGAGIRIPPFAPFMVLIVLPFLVSRWARDDAPGLVAFAERHARAISQITMAGIVFYLFSLDSAQALFTLAPATLATGLAATLAFYAVAIALAAAFTGDSPEGRAVYWHMVTRYITLALILASFSLDRFGPSFLVPIMLAYVVQLTAAGVLKARMLARAAG
jgi:predicted Na+-dependent transporter